jgi:hypothetical protein
MRRILNTTKAYSRRNGVTTSGLLVSYEGQYDLKPWKQIFINKVGDCAHKRAVNPIGLRAYRDDLRFRACHFMPSHDK